MDVIQEHDAKVKFINSMSNRYDYAIYRDFCLANGFELMTFKQYADYIDPELLPAPATELPMSSEAPAAVNYPEPVGLGDTVARITKATGLDKLAELYTKVSGKPCGCSSRQEALNRLFPYNIKEENING